VVQLAALAVPLLIIIFVACYCFLCSGAGDARRTRIVGTGRANRSAALTLSREEEGENAEQELFAPSAILPPEQLRWRNQGGEVTRTPLPWEAERVSPPPSVRAFINPRAAIVGGGMDAHTNYPLPCTLSHAPRPALARARGRASVLTRACLSFRHPAPFLPTAPAVARASSPRASSPRATPAINQVKGSASLPTDAQDDASSARSGAQAPALARAPASGAGTGAESAPRAGAESPRAVSPRTAYAAGAGGESVEDSGRGMLPSFLGGRGGAGAGGVRTSRQYQRLVEEEQQEQRSLDKAIDSANRVGVWIWRLQLLVVLFIVANAAVTCLLIECRRRQMLTCGGDDLVASEADASHAAAITDGGGVAR